MEYAAEQIYQMRIVLTELKPQLEISAKETTETMKQIEAEEMSVKRATVLVKKDENIANVQAEIAKQLKMECEADLAEALPALDEAIGINIFIYSLKNGKQRACICLHLSHVIIQILFFYFLFLII